jgi:hypothetical protein
MVGDRAATLDSHVTCETLAEAERMAYVCAAYQQPCGVVVCDAHHRLLLDASADQVARARELVMLAVERA